MNPHPVRLTNRLIVFSKQLFYFLKTYKLLELPPLLSVTIPTRRDFFWRVRVLPCLKPPLKVLILRCFHSSVCSIMLCLLHLPFVFFFLFTADIFGFLHTFLLSVIFKPFAYGIPVRFANGFIGFGF